MLAVFIFFYIFSYIGQSNNITKNQLSALAINYEYTLNSYTDLAEALIIDNSIQNYLMSDEDDGYNLADGAKNTLQNAVNMYSNLVFIAVISNNQDNILYKGNSAKISDSFNTIYKDDYSKSVYCCESGPMRMNYSDVFSGKGNNTLNLYIPVYSTSIINKQVGLLCMIFDSALFNGLSGSQKINFNSQVMIVDSAKAIISGSSQNMTGNKFQYANLVKGNVGNFVAENSLFNYRKIDKWKFYLISKIPLMDMYRNSILVIVLLTIIFVTITYFSLIICKRIIDRTYRPLDNAVKVMNSVAEGKLDVRISLKNVGIDFLNMANGFNYMMDEMNTLMKQVKLEQQQMDQIRFNALQSQIQPHFLYNALDSVHWQAISTGNNELSSFVKALAQYYRLCLSNGKDVICLEQEIEHVKNYLVIQNIRYDDIIKSEIEMDEDCRIAMIPKITLQPLVENSIYHGIKVKDGEKGKIKINAYRRDDDIFVVVADNGIGMSADQIERMNRSITEFDVDSGYGIRNVNKRLKLLFGDEYGLHYEKNDCGGVTVTVHLPGRAIQKYEEVL